MSAERSENKLHRSVRWSLLTALVLGGILLPWILWGDALERWVNDFLVQPQAPPGVAGWVVALLTADVFLPVPSSLVAVASGVFLGGVEGSLVNFAGFTLGSLVGYLTGLVLGPAAARRVVGEREWERAAAWALRFGALLVLVLRPVPVLAEASTFYAGASRVRWDKYLLVSALGNGVISVAYASLGSFSADTGNLEPVLLAGFLLPGLAMFFARRFTRDQPRR